MNYPDFVASRMKPGFAILSDLTPADAHLIHMVLGISGEAGELLDAVKKSAIYRKPLDLENIVEELGDIEFFLQGLRDALGITKEATLEHNRAKLSKRYIDSYSDEQAQNRADKSRQNP